MSVHGYFQNPRLGFWSKAGIFTIRPLFERNRVKILKKSGSCENVDTFFTSIALPKSSGGILSLLKDMALFVRHTRPRIWLLVDRHLSRPPCSAIFNCSVLWRISGWLKRNRPRVETRELSRHMLNATTPLLPIRKEDPKYNPSPGVGRLGGPEFESICVDETPLTFQRIKGENWARDLVWDVQIACALTAGLFGKQVNILF